MSTIMELRDIEKSFHLPDGELIHVLKGINLKIHSGQRIAIIGRSGSGKSTLLNLIGLLDHPTSGQVICQGDHIADFGDVQMSRLRGSFVGFVFQQYHLLDRRTALENVAEPLLFADKLAMKERRHRARDLLRQVGLEDRASSMPHLLSGGEKQRVAIARALVRQPKMLLADEPTGSLDVNTGKMVLDTLFEVSATHGTTLVIVTHDPTVAAQAEIIYSLEDGHLTGQLRT